MNGTMHINQLPMKTYRWLKMNAETMALTDLSEFSQIASDPAVSLPAGVTMQRYDDSAVIDTVFEKEIARIREEDEKAIPPNGDTLVGTAQKIPTGMGVSVDRLMEETKTPVEVYTVEENARVAEPVLFRFSPEDKSASLLSQVFHVKRNAEVTILTDAYTHRSFAGCFGIRTHLLVEEGARVTLVRVQMLGGGFTHFDDLGAVVHRDAHLSMIRLDFGTDAAYSGLCCNLLGDDASFDCEAAYLARRKQSYDYNYVVTHRGRRTKGVMHFHGVLLDEAKKLLRGTIDFRAGAKGADGEENEDALILSDRAVNRTIPLILCQEEDINGHHGATIGQLSDDMLFYMQSRGFSMEEAKKLMIRAKIMRVMNLIPDGDLKSHVNAYLCDTL